MITSKQTRKEHGDTNDKFASIAYTESSCIFQRSPTVSIRLCVHECMHVLGTRVQDLGKNMHMLNKENVHLLFGLYSK